MGLKSNHVRINVIVAHISVGDAHWTQGTGSVRDTSICLLQKRNLILAHIYVLSSTKNFLKQTPTVF